VTSGLHDREWLAFLIMKNPPSRARREAGQAAPSAVPEAIAPGERRTEINQGSSFLSGYDSSFGGHQ
jgi:hypothetical protein